MLFVVLPVALFIVLLFIFMILQKRRQSSQSAVLNKMLKSVDTKSGGADSFYQKIYIKIDSLPFINRYLRKIRRRLELINQDDEYTIRKETGRITLKGIILFLIAAIVITYINRESTFVMLVSLLGVFIVIENLTEQMINKVENRLLEQELEFFSEVRHAFHSTSMVEEAVYDASLIEEQEIVSQANVIYNILISADPEIELEKYYDVAPNKYLKIFAGVSYLTKEFGDRKVNGVSLYLKDMNNITQELQLEILKRDKLDYLFKSLTYIAVAPILLIHPLKNWSMSNFASTAAFYEGKLGFLFEIIIIAMIFLSYSLIVRIKDNVDKKVTYSTNDAWQEKVYRLPLVERIIDALVPNTDQPAYARASKLLRDTASTLKMEWLYVNKVISAVVTFVVVLMVVAQMHSLAEESILSGSGEDGGIMGNASERELQELKEQSAADRVYIASLMDSDEVVKAVQTLPADQAIATIERQLYILNVMPLSDNVATNLANKIYSKMTTERSRSVLGRADIENAILSSGIEMPREGFVPDLAQEIVKVTRTDNRSEITLDDIKEALTNIYKVELSPEQLTTNAERMYTKLKDLSSNYFKWTELAIAIACGFFAFFVPNLFLTFQKKMRQLEMDDEVMQYQTIILMLMHIERVSVEYIVEWLTRFSNIFREPMQRCLNNYEAGAYEALEELKDEVTFKPFIRIVESLQSAIENVKITDAFDELESERAFFQEKRKEANERLIAKKAMIGKILGFAPMVTLFIAYLIGPMIATSLGDMGTYFTQMGAML